MLSWLKGDWKKRLFYLRSLLAGKVVKHLMHLLVATCRVEMKGIEQFCQTVSTQRCMLVLWHNRLAIAPYLLSRYTPQLHYAALISASRDGDILSEIVHSYKHGHTIRVPHNARPQALRRLIRHIAIRKSILVATPDGPRGPRYEIKAGIALAALETEAEIFTLDWSAQKYWELNTWDKLRLPKPFTTIQATLKPSIRLTKQTCASLEEAKIILKMYMNL